MDERRMCPSERSPSHPPPTAFIPQVPAPVYPHSSSSSASSSSKLLSSANVVAGRSRSRCHNCLVSPSGQSVPPQSISLFFFDFGPPESYAIGCEVTVGWYYFRYGQLKKELLPSFHQQKFII